MQTLIILLLITTVFAFIILAGWIMETIIAKLGNIKKTVSRTKYRRNIEHHIQHNA